MLDTLFLQAWFDTMQFLLFILVLVSIAGILLLLQIRNRLQRLEIVELDIKQILIAIRNKLK